MKKVVHTFVQVLNLFFVLLTLLIAAIAILKREWIETALTWIESFVQGLGQWNYLIIFFTSVLESFPFLGVVIPGMNS